MKKNVVLKQREVAKLLQQEKIDYTYIKRGVYVIIRSDEKEYLIDACGLTKRELLKRIRLIKEHGIDALNVSGVKCGVKCRNISCNGGKNKV
jgi:hypothetical protein